MRQKQRYYADVASCVSCDRIYPVAQSNNRLLCIICKTDSLKWNLKAEN